MTSLQFTKKKSKRKFNLLKEDIIICNICFMEIKPKEAYIELKEFYYENNLKDINYYHVTCFRNMLNHKKNMNLAFAQANQLFNKLNERI